MDLDITNFIKDKYPIQSPTVSNIGLNLYENLFLMKPFIKEDLTLRHDENRYNTELGCQSSVYPLSIKSVENWKIKVRIQHFLAPTFVGSRLFQIDIPSELYSKISFIFSSQPVLQSIAEEILINNSQGLNDLSEIEINTPEHITKLIKDMPKTITVAYEMYNLEDELLKPGTYKSLTYLDVYEYEGEKYSALNMPIELEQEIVDLYKKYGKVNIKSELIDVEDEEFTNISYSGETFDMADTTAIEINKITEVCWDPSRDIASSLDVQNPGISLYGTQFSILNSLYNHLLNLMRSNSYYSGDTNISEAIILLANKEGSFITPFISLLQYNNTAGDIPLNPEIINYRNYKKQLDIIKEYVSMNLSLAFFDKQRNIPHSTSNIIGLKDNRTVDASTYNLKNTCFKRKYWKQKGTSKEKVTDIERSLPAPLKKKPVRVTIRENSFFVDAVHLFGEFDVGNLGGVKLQESNIFYNNLNLGMGSMLPRVTSIKARRNLFIYQTRRSNNIEVEVDISRLDEIVNTKLKGSDVTGMTIELDEITDVRFMKGSRFYCDEPEPHRDSEKQFTSDISSIVGVTTPYMIDRLAERLDKYSDKITIAKDKMGNFTGIVPNPDNPEPENSYKLQWEGTVSNNIHCLTDPLTTALNSLIVRKDYSTNSYLHGYDPINAIRPIFKYGEHLYPGIKSFGSDAKYIEEHLLGTLKSYVTSKVPTSVYPLIADIRDCRNILVPAGEIYYSITTGKLDFKEILKVNPYSTMLTPKNFIISKRRRDWLCQDKKN